MNKSFFILFIFCTAFTLPTKTKISIPDKISHFFSGNKKETVDQQEFYDVKDIELFCDQGNIMVHTWKQSSCIIEVKKQTSSAQSTESAVGFIQDNNLLQIETQNNLKKQPSTTHFNLIVPEKSNLKLATKHGNIAIKNVYGTVNAQTVAGNIEIIDGSGNAILKNDHGNIIIQKEYIPNNHSISAKSQVGNITLHTSQKNNASIEAHTKSGKIYSHLLITLEPQTTKLTEETYKQQRHHLKGVISKDAHQATQGKIELCNQSGTIKIKPYF